MIAVKTNESNEVVSIRYVAKSLLPGEVEVAEIPQEPEVGQYEVAVMILVDGKIAYRVDQLPIPDPEPIPEPEPIPASELRRQAYEQECDPLLIASLGYEAEGNAEAAANCKAQYLVKKAEIRERIPDEEVEQ